MDSLIRSPFYYCYYGAWFSFGLPAPPFPPPEEGGRRSFESSAHSGSVKKLAYTDYSCPARLMDSEPEQHRTPPFQKRDTAERERGGRRKGKTFPIFSILILSLSLSLYVC